MAETPKKPGLLTLPWFRPLHRRVIVCALPVLGLLFEILVGRDQLWMLLWVAFLAYGVWTFFISFDREMAKQENHGKPEN
jgi:hypothetical protein